MSRPAITALIAADKARGLTTVLIAIDGPGMAKYKVKPVAKASDARQCKGAIDAIYAAIMPAYICILGSVDVVRHVDLINPLKSDGDDVGPSDLPCACDHTFSQKIEDFMAPTRVVGRLPDVTAGKDASYLVGVLDTAARAQSQAASRPTRVNTSSASREAIPSTTSGSSNSSASASVPAARSTATPS
jgi:hypothetical protein